MTVEIIGRDAELPVVQGFLDRPVDGLRALVLEGEAGIGKSTLWLAGLAAARERSFRVLTSRPAETERTLPNLVLGDLFGDTPPQLLAALPVPRRHALESALLLGDGPDLPVDPRALGVAIATVLSMLADGQGLLLAIDDDQWMDPSSAATIRFALRRLSLQPILLLLARRIDGAPTSALEEAMDPAEVERLRIGPLSAGAIHGLLGHRLGIALPRPALLQLHEISGGNPFYALELARARSADPARDATVPVAVPASLERIVGERLGTLDAPTRGALLLVAAHGRLPVELLGALAVAPDEIRPALALNLIEMTAGVIRFTHPLLAAGAYHGMSHAERRAAHRLLATVFEDPVDRGRHLALGADQPDHGLAASLESAAIVARVRGMPIAAAELAEHALRLTPLDALDDRQRRALATARAHLQAGEGVRARAIANDLLATAPAGPRRAEALILKSELEAPGTAVTLLIDAQTEAAGVPALQAAIESGLADAGSYTQGLAWAERHARAALKLAEGLDDDALRATALAILAGIRLDHGDRQALKLAEQASRLAARLDDPRQVRGAGWILGTVLTVWCELDRARDWLEAQIDTWRDRDEQVRSELLGCLALVELWSGHWGMASEYAEQAHEIDSQYGVDLPQDHLLPALIALHRGQLANAAEHSRLALSLARGSVMPMHEAILATCDLWGGRPTPAVAGFFRAERMADLRGWGEPALRFWRADYAEALLQVGRDDDAASLVDDWESAAERLGRDWVLAPAMRCRGLIAAARGELVDAARLLEDAIGRHEAVGDPFGHARALLALGVVRRRARQKRTARAAMDAALSEFEALGAASWAAVTRSEVARIGGRTRIEGLSPSELSVAALVAEGRTNREIASALFLGEATVASHLSHIYAKLGIRSRTELARHVLPPAPPV
jgi:DNA-binding CsgD family transcriptional regulator